jgi:arylsulfatase A-like enzyme
MFSIPKLPTTSLTSAILLCATASLRAANPVAAGQSVSKPDLLLIMPDQMRGDCLSILGHPAVHTPNLDQLARQGALFYRAYCTVPSCIAARSALLTGRFPQSTGVVGFAAKPITVPTFPEVLDAAGYATVLVGRNMHQVAASKTCGYQQQVLGSTYLGGDAYDLDLQQSAPESGGILKVVRQLRLNCNGWRAKPWPLADDLHPTAWVVSQSRKIVAAAALTRPLFLTASFYAPHPPLFPPAKYFDAYLKADLPKPAQGDWVKWDELSPMGDRQGHRVRMEGETLRAAQAGYFGLIEHLDQQIGALVEDFKARSEKAGRSWVIVVTSDHGEMLGDHGYFRKCEPFEGSTRIPFIVAASPGLGFKPSCRSSQPVCLEDVMPTLLELAGTPSPARIDGVSLVPVLRGEDRVIRKWLHMEHATCYSRQQAFHALTDGHYKYIWRPFDGTEHLFDLDADPREERDLVMVTAQGKTLKSWRARLVQRLAGRPEGFSDGAQLIPGRPYPALHETPSGT